MMEKIDDFARRIKVEYGMFQQAILGKYSRLIAGQITPKASADFVRESHTMAESLIELIAGEAQVYLTAMHFGEAIPEMDSQTLEASLMMVKHALHTNISQLVSLIRMAATGMAANGTPMGQLAKKRLDKVEFTVIDGAQRRWDAMRYVVTVMRDFAVQTDLNKTIADLKAREFKLAKVIYDNPEKIDREFVFAIDEKVGDYPLFYDIRGRVFHPNTTARVIGHV